MRAYERFLRYVVVETTSNPKVKSTSPSTQCQFTLARMLVEEMQQMGIKDAFVDDKCYVYGHIPATVGYEEALPLGLIAHMDTSSDAKGKGVVPVLHENYNGGDIILPNGDIIDVATYPEVKKYKGETIITASGDTLLGADDKAGIAEILTACEVLLQGEIAHGKICIAFTPDEEIGQGADNFSLEEMGAQFAYTLDGGAIEEIEYESFNAAGASVTFAGKGVHPGSAKDIMVNAAKLAMEFASMLPAAECPENTEGREGFYHLLEMSGTVESASLHYIIRDHDRSQFEQRKETFLNAVADMQAKYGNNALIAEVKDQYYNMGEVIKKHYHLVENAVEAVKKAGYTPIINPIRGGTDGGPLSFMGLPCPNIGTGGMYFHGPKECISVQQMDKAVEVVLNICQIYAKTLARN